MTRGLRGSPVAEEYTPTTGEVRDRYWINDGAWADPTDALAFDRWLDQVRAEAFHRGKSEGIRLAEAASS